MFCVGLIYSLPFRGRAGVGASAELRLATRVPPSQPSPERGRSKRVEEKLNDPIAAQIQNPVGPGSCGL